MTKIAVHSAEQFSTKLIKRSIDQRLLSSSKPSASVGVKVLNLSDLEIQAKNFFFKVC